MEGYSWNQILLFFFLYCFLGWVFESVYVSVMERRLSNRGFLRGPVIPIYGFGAMMIVFATTPFRGNYVAAFLSGMLAATAFELLVGMAMELLFSKSSIGITVTSRFSIKAIFVWKARCAGACCLFWLRSLSRFGWNSWSFCCPSRPASVWL